MASINTFTFIGKLVRDPVLRKTGKGASTVTYILAQTEVTYDSDRNKKERVVYLPITSYGRQAENDAKYLKKGSTVAVSGSISSWYVKESGKSGFNFEAVDVQYLGSPSKPESGSDHSSSNGEQSYMDDWAKEYEEQQIAMEKQAENDNRPLRQRG